MITPEVETVLRAVPEFADLYLELVEEADDDPGGPAAFAELADFTAGLALQVDRFAPVLERAMTCVEEVAATSEDAEQLVGWAFLDNLSPDDLRRLERWIGPATMSLLEDMEIPAS